MPLLARICRRPALFAAAFLLCCLIVSLAADNSRATSRKALFLPLKINAADPAALTPRVDRAWLAAIENPLLIMSRRQAVKYVNYNVAWPPAPDILRQLAADNGADLLILGSLTGLGGQLSVDTLIFDRFSGKVSYSFYQDAVPLAELDTLMRDTTKNIIEYINKIDLIYSIEPMGNKRIDAGAIMRNVESRPNEPVNTAQLRKDMRAIFSMGYFEDVLIEAVNTQQGKKIFFRVKEKPLISKVFLEGLDELSEEDVRGAADISPNTILNQIRLNQAIERIKELYKNKGFYNTKVTTRLSEPADDQVELRLVIDEGQKIFIGDISFTGNQTFDDDELEDVIETKTRGWFSWISDSGVLKTDQLRQDSARLAVFYYNHGFIEAKVGDAVVEQSDEAITISFPIKEGPRFRVGTVDITGELIEDKDTLLAMLDIREQEYLNREILRGDSLKLTDLYAEQGYAFAEAVPKVEKSGDNKRVNITLEMDKGPLVVFNRVEIAGNVRTRDNVIRRELTIEEGGTFSSKALRDSNRNLQRLGFFEEANITPQPTADESMMDILVEVKERSTGQFSVGAGYSSSDYLMFTAEISENNLLGTGNKLSLSADISGTATRYKLSFQNPRLFDTKLSGGVNLFNWEKDYDDYTKDSSGGAVSFGHPLAENWRMYYKYGYTDTTLTNLSEDASYYIQQSANINTASTVQFSVVRDTRNRYFSPNEGSKNSIILEYAGGPLGAEAAFTKVEGASSWYYPLPLQSIFHLKASAGRAYENEDDMLPIYELFYLGGLNSIRGFKSSHISPTDPDTGERIGGDKMWYTNVEVIFPLLKDAGLQGVVFLDFGNVYGVDENWDFGTYKKAAGIGFRWVSPLGPLRLEWGYNLDPEDDEEQSNWDFSIGSVF